MKTVTFKFNGDQVEVETSGFTGGECYKETADVKAALGLTDVEEADKREAFTHADARQEVHRGR